jgi:2-oxo-3-hexenedioate decarboxylase
MAIQDIAGVVATLVAAEDNRTARTRITDEWPQLDTKIAYEAQQALVQHRVAQGDQVIGVKLGLTSRAKQVRMGINSPLTAVLFKRYRLSNDQPIPLGKLIQPRIEPEIVFVMQHELRGPDVTPEQAMAAVKSIHAGFEVIDSRFIDYSFALPDVISDNASSAFFYMSDESVGPKDLDLKFEAVALSLNGKTLATATGAAVQGHPAIALALAANEMAARGQCIPAGSIVLTGGMTDAIPVSPGDQISAEFTTLGSLFVGTEN